MLFQNAFEAAALTALAGIPNRYGYATDGRSFLLTHRVPLTPKIRRSHQVHYYLELLRPLGIQVEPEPPTLRTTPDEDAEAIEHLRAFGVDTKKVLIGLNPGSVYGTAKRWLPERFAEVADRVAAEHGGVVLIFGGHGEEELGAALAGRMEAPTVVLSDRKSTRLNSSHSQISYAVFCLKKKKKHRTTITRIEVSSTSLDKTLMLFAPSTITIYTKSH